MNRFLSAGALAPIALAAAFASSPAAAQVGRISGPSLFEPTSGRVPSTSNSSDVTNWRLTAGSTFNGVAGAFDGTARLLFTTSEAAGTFVCSGSLMKGGQYVLTAAHCVDGLINMSVQFGLTNGVALQTRNVVASYAAPGWNGTLDTGADIALVKLDHAVTNLPTYELSTTNDVGKQYIMTGYGSTSTGSSSTKSNWGDADYGHFGYNTYDTTSDQFGAAWDAYSGEGIYTPPTYGLTYMSDFDAYNVPNAGNYNTLKRVADLTGGSWTSGTTLGVQESLIAGGDSGGGDFIWDGSKWVLSGVHSWGWQFCPGRISGPSCDYRTGNDTSFGDLSGATAVVNHVKWINSVITAVPEPETYALMVLGLGLVGAAARRRRAA